MLALHHAHSRMVQVVAHSETPSPKAVLTNNQVEVVEDPRPARGFLYEHRAHN